MEVFNLNIIPGSVAPIIHASQYDEDREFRANLFEGDQVFELTGAETISVNVRKPDGNVVTAAVVNTGSNYVEFSTTLQMTACAGANLCQLRIEDSPRKIGTLNFILAVERDPLEGGIQSASEIDNLETQVAGMVAVEVANQYDSANVIFDNTPTAGHGVGYAVTSEGVKTELDTLSTAIAGKVDQANFDATNLPIQSGSATNTKDYIDSGLSGKADITDVKELKALSQSFTIPANSSITIQANSSRIQCLLFGVSDSQYVASVAYLIGGYVTASRCVVTNLSGLTGLTINSSSTTDMKFVITNTQAFSVSFNIYNLIGSGFTVVT